jgi:4-alpha-glucanotransferase
MNRHPTSKPTGNPLVARALSALGVERLVLAVHEQMLPSLPEEDLGRGSELSRGASEFFDFASELGFNAVQLGPQGQTTGGNPSPYDGAIFARNAGSLALWPLTEAGNGELLTPEEVAELSRGGDGERIRQGDADRSSAEALRLAIDRLLRQDTPVRRGLGAAAAVFQREAAEWLSRDALFEALTIEHGSPDARLWPAEDRELFGQRGKTGTAAERRLELAERHAELVRRLALAQFLLHRQHGAFQEQLRGRGMALFGDLQVGLPPRDTWAWRSLFLEALVMGAPPSRTTPIGQPWGYPVLSPEVDCAAFVRLRIEKMLREYDGLRIDHPHGWVCPWVYDATDAGSAPAVERGTRLFESPDDPRCARFAIARIEQLRLDRPRYDDGWVGDLEEAQVAHYAQLTDEILACADRLRRPREMLLWELLSTQPYPLERVLQRLGLGRFRVTQKVRLDDPRDGYRSEHARPQDWMMIGNHDTQPIWAVVERWAQAGELGARAEYLAGRLSLTALPAEPKAVAQAQFADLFASAARNVLVFVSDLLGETRWYNIPGVVDPENWTLRVPRNFRALYGARRAQGGALDLPRALVSALEAKKLGEREAGLIAELRASSSP